MVLTVREQRVPAVVTPGTVIVNTLWVDSSQRVNFRPRPYVRLSRNASRFTFLRAEALSAQALPSRLR